MDDETKSTTCPCCHSHEHEHHDHDGCGCDHTHEHHHDHGGCSCGHDHKHHDHDGCCCGHDHNAPPSRKEPIILGIGAAMLALGLLLPGIWGEIVLGAAFLTVAFDILVDAFQSIRHGDIFGEGLLMTIAGIGAVLIGEIPEGILVFLLFRLGEYLQSRAVNASRKSISSLLDIRPDRANLLVNGEPRETDARTIQVGQTILVRPGERIPLDGTVVSGSSLIDTAALTGESMPREVNPGSPASAGCINLNAAIELKVEKPFGESAASKILEMVEHAGERKAQSEKFITRFARVYTPLVVAAAVLVTVIPPLVGWLTWTQSIYSALCFLTISCPCALVISVPLSFFAGIGRASRAGVLVKGGNHLETLADAEIVAFDKTGTLTEGRFTVAKLLPADGTDQKELLRLAALAECRSTHPIARSILEACGNVDSSSVTEASEKAGHGVSVTIDGRTVLAGRRDFLAEAGVDVPQLNTGASTAVYVAEDGIFRGTVLLRDQPKADAGKALADLRALGIRKSVILSGDSKDTVREIGRELGADEALGQLLPSDKLHALDQLRSELSPKGALVYGGDGINDTPALAAADLGVAMGGLGSDAAIEAADVVIMGDEPSRLASGIKAARITRRIATENIIIALTTKVLVMILAAFQLVDLWLAVLSDVGICMVCILNTLRINRAKL